MKAFVKAYQDKFHKTPDAMAVTGYDAANVLIDAIRRAGKTDPTAIRDAIAATKDFHGASGVITIDSERNASKPIVVLELEAGSRSWSRRTHRNRVMSRSPAGDGRVGRREVNEVTHFLMQLFVQQLINGLSIGAVSR